MRFFEIVMIIMLAACFLLLMNQGRRAETPQGSGWGGVDRWMLIANIGMILVLAAHFMIEKYRWQMIPLYGLVAAAALLSIIGGTAAGGRWRAGASIAGIIVLIPAGLLPALFPVPSVPVPTGAYPVGTFSTMVIDTSRKEIYSDDPNEPRAMMIQVWYPAAATPGLSLAPWVDSPQVVAPSISRWLDFPAFFLDHLALAKSHSLLNAPLAETPDALPVITFSHGWNGIRQQSTFLMEELASHGYVVVSIEHTYGARVVVFPDGRVVENNPRALPYDDPPEILEPAADILGDQWAGDIGFVLDILESWNENDPEGRFTGRLDMSRVGASGHSTGGGAAVEFCGRDARCRVLVGLDAYLTPVSDAVLNGGLPQPALLLFSERWPNEKNNALLGRLLMVSAHMERASILGTAHYDFSDLPLLSPLAQFLGLKGPLKAETALAITREAALVVFDAVLRNGAPAALHALTDTYPELKFDLVP